MLHNPANNNTQGGGIARHRVDTTELPEWGTAGDGSFVKLVADAEYLAEFAAWQSAACDHGAARQFTGKFVNAGGVDVYKRYCRDCGIATTQALGYNTVQGTTITVFDPAKREEKVSEYIDARRQALDELTCRAADRQQPHRRSDYAEYLNSPEWRDRRAAVLKRCGGTCEGCGKLPATDAHHMSYRNVGHEFLFELVGLCRPCHDRWHEQQK